MTLGARLRRAPAPLIAFLLALVVYGGALAITRPPSITDEPHYALMAFSIARDGDVDLRNQYADPGQVAAVTNLPGLDPHARDFGNGKLHSFHGVGLPVLLVPAALVSTDMLVMRIELVLLAALAAALLMRIIRRIDETWRGWLAWGLVAFSLPVVAYSNQLYPELPGALAILLAANGLMAGPARRVEWTLGAIGAGYLPWLHVRFLPITVALVLIAAWRLWTLRRELSPAVGAALFAVPVVASLALLAVMFQRWYGSPLPTVLFTTTNATPTVAPEALLSAVQEEQNPSAVGYLEQLITYPDASTIYRRIVGAVFSPGAGWLPYAPVHLLALAGIAALFVVRWRWALAGLVVAAGYLLLIFTSSVDSVFAYPGRYMVVLIPLVAIPFAVALRVRPAVPVAVAVGALTVLLTFLGVTRLQDVQADNSSSPAKLVVARQLAPLWPENPSETGEYIDRVLEPARTREPGVLFRSRAVELPATTYNAAVTLEEQPDRPDASAEIQIQRADGEVVTTLPVRAADVDGTRTFLITFQVAAPVGVRLEVRGDGFTATGGQFAGTAYPTEPIPSFYQWPKTLGWTLLVIAMGAGLAYVLVSSSRRERPTA